MIDLSELQIRMLEAGEFHIDGGNSIAGREDSADLCFKGLVTCYDSGSDKEQYTCYNYTITEKGKDALRKNKNE